MKGNDYQPTTGVQAVKGVVQRLLQHIQFTVNLNANRLKGAPSRVAVAHVQGSPKGGGALWYAGFPTPGSGRLQLQGGTDAHV